MPALPSTMTAIEIEPFGPPEGLKPTSRPLPTPGDGEVLVHVSHAGVNRPDVLQRLGGYPPPPGASDIPGLEIAGTIVAVGPNAGYWTVGDETCALVSGGGYAEYCTAPAPQCLPIPKGYTLEQAASVVETAYTVWANVFMRGHLKEGETILIHGGSSGIGTMAIQMAKAFGARVFATAGSAEKCKVCEDLGAIRGAVTVGVEVVGVCAEDVEFFCVAQPVAIGVRVLKVVQAVAVGVVGLIGGGEGS